MGRKIAGWTEIAVFGKAYEDKSFTKKRAAK